MHGVKIKHVQKENLSYQAMVCHGVCVCVCVGGCAHTHAYICAHMHVHMHVHSSCVFVCINLNSVSIIQKKCFCV